MVEKAVLKKVFKGGLFLTIFLLLVSCGDINMFSPFGTEGDKPLLDLSLSEGEVVSPNRSLVVTVHDPQDLDDPVPYRLQVTFLDGNGAVIETREIQDILAMDPWMPLPDRSSPGNSIMESSFMQVTFEVFDNQERLLESKIVAFFVSDMVPHIDALEVYPAGGIELGYQCLILARTDISVDDSYLRWTMDDAVLAEGMGAEISNQLIWEAPDKAGVYDLSLEIFPEEPPQILNGTYPFQAAERKSIELFVSEKRDSQASEGDAFFHHFSFSGTLSNAGFLSDLSNVIGEPYPALQDGRFGYHFPGNANLDLPLKPSEADNVEGNEAINALADEKLTLFLEGAAFLEGSGVLFALFDDKNLLARLEKDPEGNIVFYLDGGAAEVVDNKEGVKDENGEDENGVEATDLEPEAEPFLSPDPNSPVLESSEEELSELVIILDSKESLEQGFPEGHIVYRISYPLNEPITGEFVFSFDPAASTLELAWNPLSAPGAENDLENDIENDPDGELLSYFLPIASLEEELSRFQPDRVIMGGEGALFLSFLAIGASNNFEQ
jgi:hypothetical protein